MIIKDHKDNLNRELSLVEQKKQQWAKEREEMAKLEQYHSKIASKYERNTIRTQLITNTEIVHQNNNFHQKNFGMRRIRSPSLPPIERYEKTMTRQGSNNSDQSSGYLSGSGGSSSLPVNANVIDAQSHFDYNYGQTTHHFESLNNLQNNNMKKYSLTSSLNEYPSSQVSNIAEREMEFNHQEKPIGTPSSDSSITSQDVFSVSSYANSSTIDSINYQKTRESGRAKWNSYLFDSFSKGNNNGSENIINGRSSRNTTNGPIWLEKSLSEARDSEEETMSISVQSVSSFLRGQNVPIDPFVLAEREEKRRKALELQQAIKQQLEERENLRKYEKEKKYLQEKQEEERLAMQMEIERQRLEKEQKIQNEKLENERKKEETMKKALEKAALEAKIEKEKKRREKAIALQNSLDETISIQKVGERTEILIEEIVKATPVKNLEIQRALSPEKIVNDAENEDDGETILIGTPIKLKKKNLDNLRRKNYIHQRRQPPSPDEPKSTSEEEISTPKSANSTDNNNNNVEKLPITQSKTISDLEGIAFVLQTMPLVPFVPITNEMLGGINQLNNLAFLMAQNRINSPNIMLPIISPKDNIQTPNEKLELSQFIIPPNNPSPTITLQIQQVPPTPQPSPAAETIPQTPENGVKISNESVDEVVKIDEAKSQQVKDNNNNNSTPTIPHDGTFTKEENQQTQDAFTSTSAKQIKIINEDENDTVKILTPKKYRNIGSKYNKSIGTQTESFLFCEYCSYQHQHRCSHTIINNELISASNDNNMNNLSVQQEKLKEKKVSDRPKWGVRNPPIKYLKASERDPFYGKDKIKKKKTLKKAVSECDKSDDGCNFKDCPLVKNSPLLPKRQPKSNLEALSLCSNLLPIKTDRFGNVCLLDEPSFVMNEAFRRIHHHPRSELYVSDTESSVDIKHKSFFSRRNDFQDIFVD